MKKLILIFLLLIPFSAFSLSWNCKDKKSEESYFLLDPVQGIDYVFKIKDANIKQVGVINYFDFTVTHLKSSLRVKSTQTAGEDSDAPDQRRIELDELIRKSWPKVGRVKYYRKQ